MKIRSFVAWLPRDTAGAVGARWTPPADERDRWRSWSDGPLSVHFVPRSGAPASTGQQRLPTLVLGDDSEFRERAGDNVASGVPIQYDEAARELSIATSIVALPPVYLYRGPHGIALTSDLFFLRRIPGISLELDGVGITELGHFGHPVGYRTLFRNVELVPGSGVVRVGVSRSLAFSRVWTLPERDRLGWRDFVEAQIETFLQQVRRLDVSSSVLSLTAGLDTRTVFAALAAEKRLIGAVTMSGPHRSLDARIASRLCCAYGVSHDTVTFDHRFTQHLPRFMEAASRLSGGLATLDQAPEVFLYDQLDGAHEARLSGNLGNQVGRGGTEGISIRGADLRVLAPGLRREPPGGHWLLERLGGDDRATLDFILGQEIPFTLVGNYGIGNHFAVQQSPYASRLLIETLAARPVSAGLPSGSRVRMRLRDLRHRFLGEPERHSFQRSLVRRIGGYAARCPVNWGWRPAGGVSPGGLILGAATMVGMLARAKGFDAGSLHRPLRWSGLPALHDFRESRRWLRSDLREYTCDTLRSRATTEAGLFQTRTLSAILDEHYRDRRDHYATITFALDVALAHRVFCA